MAYAMWFVLLVSAMRSKAQYIPFSEDSGLNMPIYGSPSYSDPDIFLPYNTTTALLCNSTIASANASGVYQFNPVLPNGTALNDPSPAWAITVDADMTTNTLQQSLWYDTAGQNYSDDLALEYDVCAFPLLTSLSNNTIRLSQNDNGDCSETFSQPCMEYLINNAQNSALQWTTYSSPPPNANLTAGDLPYICSAIALAIIQDVPEECSQEFDQSTAVFGDATMTGFNTSILDTPCHISGDSRTFSRVATVQNNYSQAAYDQGVRGVVPVITVFFPVANYRRQLFDNHAFANMTCLVPRNFAQGSRISPALPAGKPYRSGGGGGLSGGQIAGIVLGSVIGGGLLIVAGIIVLKRRNRRKSLGSKSRKKHEMGAQEAKSPFEADGNDMHELEGNTRAEIDNSRKISELEDGSGRVAESDGAPMKEKK